MDYADKQSENSLAIVNCIILSNLAVMFNVTASGLFFSGNANNPNFKMLKFTSD